VEVKQSSAPGDEVDRRHSGLGPCLQSRLDCAPESTLVSLWPPLWEAVLTKGWLVSASLRLITLCSTRASAKLEDSSEEVLDQRASTRARPMLLQLRAYPARSRSDQPDAWIHFPGPSNRRGRACLGQVAYPGGKRDGKAAAAAENTTK
jgi:hypothetical protein